MCFSAQASFIAAAGLGIIGCLTFTKVRNYKSMLLAAGPSIFALQQAVEGFVWLGLRNPNCYACMLPVATLFFLFVAAVVWPLLIPLSLYILEYQPRRKKLLLGMVGAGSISVLISLILWVYMGIAPQIVDHHINYAFASVSVHQWMVDWITMIDLFLYSLATIASFFISSVPQIWILGILVAASFIISYIFYYLAFGSVWCFFAALMSITTCYILSRYNKYHHYM
jgi:hypothetical protein